MKRLNFRFMAVVMLFALALILSPVMAQTIISEDFVKLPGNPKPIPSFLSLHRGFHWTRPILVKVTYTGEKLSYIHSDINYNKKVQPEDVWNYYEKRLKARGWKVMGPAGGSTSLGGFFTKGHRKVMLNCFMANSDGRIPSDEEYRGKKPVGTMVELLYK